MNANAHEKLMAIVEMAEPSYAIPIWMDRDSFDRTHRQWQDVRRLAAGVPAVIESLAILIEFIEKGGIMSSRVIDNAHTALAGVRKEVPGNQLTPEEKSEAERLYAELRDDIANGNEWGDAVPDPEPTKES